MPAFMATAVVVADGDSPLGSLPLTVPTGRLFPTVGHCPLNLANRGHHRQGLGFLFIASPAMCSRKLRLAQM